MLGMRREGDPLERVLHIAGAAVLAAAFAAALVLKEVQVDESPSLVFTQWWETAMEPGSLRALADEFEERHPGLKVILDTRPYREIREQLAAPGEPERLSDILGLDPLWLSDLTGRGVLEPLDRYHADLAEDYASLLPNMVPRPFPQARFWALPLTAFMDALFYRIDLLQAAGFDRPPKNQDELLRAARGVNDPPQDRYGLTLALGPESSQGVYRDFFPWLWAAGASFFQDGEIRCDTPEGLALFSFAEGLYRENLAAPGSFTKTAEDKREEFISGRAAMMIGPASDIPLIRERGVSFGVTAAPGPASYIGKPVFGLQGWYGGISRRSRYKNEAWAFLLFLTENRSRIGAAAHAVPGSRSAEAYISGDPLYAKVYDIYEAGEAQEELAGVKGLGEIEAVFQEELYRMAAEGQPAAETARAIQRRLSGIDGKTAREIHQED